MQVACMQVASELQTSVLANMQTCKLRGGE